MQREFTGRHLLMVLVTGFGIVIAVNFFMASVAAGIFSGVVVENSYVASQKFNRWLAEAERQQALGWQADIGRAEDGRLLVETDGVPAMAQASAAIRRPLGAPQSAQVALQREGDNRFLSPEALAPGRWIVRIEIEAAGKRWRMERHLP